MTINNSESLSTQQTDLAIQVQNVVYRPVNSPFELVIENLHLLRGEKVALTGPSGSGKTTLLSLVSGQLLPQQGHIEVESKILRKMSQPEREAFRLRNIGIVFQDFRLINYLTVAENLALKSTLLGSHQFDAPSSDEISRIAAFLKLEHLLKRYPARLSQGEMQRVAIGRAVYGQPGVILADEPTGNLDPRTAAETIDFLLSLTQASNATLLLVTHDHSLLPLFDRHVDLRDI